MTTHATVAQFVAEHAEFALAKARKYADRFRGGVDPDEAESEAGLLLIRHAEAWRALPRSSARNVVMKAVWRACLMLSRSAGRRTARLRKLAEAEQMGLGSMGFGPSSVEPPPDLMLLARDADRQIGGTTARVRRAAYLRGIGHSCEEIAEICKVSRSIVRGWLVRVPEESR